MLEQTELSTKMVTCASLVHWEATNRSLCLGNKYLSWCPNPALIVPGVPYLQHICNTSRRLGIETSELGPTSQKCVRSFKKKCYVVQHTTTCIIIATPFLTCTWKFTSRCYNLADSSKFNTSSHKRQLMEYYLSSLRFPIFLLAIFFPLFSLSISKSALWTDPELLKTQLKCTLEQGLQL